MDTSEQEQEQVRTYQEQFNYGQARVNFELVRVDAQLIEALNALVEILKTLKEERSASHLAKQIDLTRLVTALEAATTISGKVADIDPPGCKGPGPYPRD